MSSLAVDLPTADGFVSGALCALREDLRLMPGPAAHDGTPTWTIHDPVRNRYFRIGWLSFEMLSRWSAGDAGRMLSAVADETTLRPAAGDLDALLRFLLANNLIVQGADGRVDDLLRQHEADRRHWLARVLHGYLFVRIPLVSPDRFLRRTLPLVAPLYGRGFALLVAFMAVVGVTLTVRQWDAFVSTFMQYATPAGIAGYVLALLTVKVAHELAHAYTATRFGCRVPTMGVALMVLFPVLYTDTTAAWRLTSRRQRLAIGAAGVAAELAVAAAALFAWSFLPDGPLRGVAFFLATASLLLTLVVNLNPLMRFDGYYLLADWTGIDNLQGRAFAMGRWRLRELLFGLGDPPPETLPAPTARFLWLFAWATWLYRAVVFLGIALLVYHLFFKVLGLLLFAVEVGWLLALPVGRELRRWWSIRRRIVRRPRSALTGFAGAALLALLFIPWQTEVRFQGTLEAVTHVDVFAPHPSRLVAVHARELAAVEAGDLLLVTERPALGRDVAQAQREMAALELRLARQAANPADRQGLRVLREELATGRSRLEGLSREHARLEVRAPVAGVVRDLAPGLHAGRWLDARTPLMSITGPDRAVVKALVVETDLGRLRPGQEGRFVPDDLASPSLPVTIASVDPVVSRTLDRPYLASVHGGAVPVRQDRRGQLVPERGMFRVTLRPTRPIAVPGQVQRGAVRVEGEARSLAGRLYESAAAVLVREAGF